MTETAQNATGSENKTTKGKAPKKTAKAKAAAPRAKPVKAAKSAREKKERAPRESREGWGTFALKMPVAEREAFHNAAGPARASRFARAVLVAFAAGDDAAFKAVVKEAREPRQ